MSAPLRFGLAAGLCTVLLLSVSLPVAAKAVRPDSEAAIIFIRAVTKQTLAIQNDVEIPLSARQRKVEELLQNSIAIDTIGRFSVGRYWRKMTDEQKVKYRNLFEQWIIHKYALRLAEASGYAVEVLDTAPAGKRDLFVRTRIARPHGKEPVSVDWRLRQKSDRIKIIDVVIEGVSMLVTQKTEFNTILRSKGIDHLIDVMAEQAGKITERSG